MDRFRRKGSEREREPEMPRHPGSASHPPPLYDDGTSRPPGWLHLDASHVCIGFAWLSLKMDYRLRYLIHTQDPPTEGSVHRSEFPALQRRTPPVFSPAPSVSHDAVLFNGSRLVPRLPHRLRPPPPTSSPRYSCLTYSGNQTSCRWGLGKLKKSQGSFSLL